MMNELSLEEYLELKGKVLNLIKGSEKRLTLKQIAGKIKGNVDDALQIIYDLQSDNHLVDLLPFEENGRDNQSKWEVEYYGD